MSKILTNEQVQALHNLSEAILTAQTVMQEDFPNYSARLGAILEHTNDVKNYAVPGEEIILCGVCAADFEVYHKGLIIDKLRDLTRGKGNCKECGRHKYCGLYLVGERPY